MSFEYEKYSGDHRGGTKSYSLHLIIGPDGALCIWQWGKKGSFGSVKIERYRDRKEAETQFSRKISDRRNEGYDMMHGLIQRRFENLGDIFAIMNRALPMKLSAGDINTVQKSYDTSNWKGGDSTNKDFQEASNAIAIKVKEQAEIAVERERAAELEAMKSNPMFGMF